VVSGPAPVVSVVVPCFNAAATIDATLSSVVRQTLGGIEIVCVDDGSTDATRAILEARAATDARFRVVSQPNGGVAAARNAGVAASRGRYIAFLDADDLWEPTHVEAALRHFSERGNLGVSYCSARFIDTAGRETGRANPKLGPLTPQHLLSSNPTTTCSTLVVRRDVFRDVGDFRTGMRHTEDQEWLFRVSLSGWAIAGRPDVNVSYRTSPGGLASDLEGMLAGFETMIAEARRLAPQLVARNEAAARARMNLFLARRAVRLKLPARIARHYFIAAVKAYPRVLLAEPKSTMTTFGAALAPRLVHLVLDRTMRA